VKKIPPNLPFTKGGTNMHILVGLQMEPLFTSAERNVPDGSQFWKDA